jgi:arsenite methyltransferase
MTDTLDPTAVDLDALRASIRAEYAAVASEPERGFHFHIGYRLAAILGYRQEWIEMLPAGAVVSMAGTGNPFALGEIRPGERVADCGSGAGADALIAARLVGPAGHVIGVDMTSEMLAKARANAREAGLANVEFRLGLLESLPIETGWADVVISNGVLNLVPDKAAALAEMYRVFVPGRAPAAGRHHPGASRLGPIQAGRQPVDRLHRRRHPRGGAPRARDRGGLLGRRDRARRRRLRRRSAALECRGLRDAGCGGHR